MYYSKFLNSQNWNIGFTVDTVVSLIENKALSKVQWMKHDFRDRFFADPFVLNLKNDKIILLAEELIFNELKGRIVKLTVDQRSKLLLERVVILELNTHLSYPAIIRSGEFVYIYPENIASNKLTLYRYNEESDQIYENKTLINEPVADATIFEYNEKYWLIATKAPQTEENAYLFTSKSFDGEFEMVGIKPIVKERCCARPAGNIFTYQDCIYRPAQICTNRYGEGIIINKIDLISNNSYVEKSLFTLYPKSFRYNLGLHTINFYERGCVIDGCGYFYPWLGRGLNFLRSCKILFKKYFL